MSWSDAARSWQDRHYQVPRVREYMSYHLLLSEVSAPSHLYLLIRPGRHITPCKSQKWKHKPFVMLLPFTEACWSAICCYRVTFIKAAFKAHLRTEAFVFLPVLGSQDSWKRMLLYPGWNLLRTTVLIIPRVIALHLLYRRHWTRH